MLTKTTLSLLEFFFSLAVKGMLRALAIIPIKIQLALQNSDYPGP